MPDANAPLGVFDSGLGGLTVVRALLGQCPNERIVYLGDTARVPYGTRSAETVIRYARRCAAELMRSNIKALVVACNTASAVALEMLRVELDLPVVGVIEPGARAALSVLQARPELQHAPLGVLGTQGTVRSGAYPRAMAQLSTRYEVRGQAAPLLVPLVEEGWLQGEVPRLAIKRYLEPLIAAKVRVIVLGCTHYPLLKPLIMQVAEELAGEPVAIVDSAQATAFAIEALLDEGKIPRSESLVGDGGLRLMVTDLPESFQAVAARFLGRQAPSAVQVDLSIEG